MPDFNPDTTPTPGLREALLSHEPQTPDLKADYERRVREMIEKKLSPVTRVVYVGVTIVAVLQFVLFVYLALIGGAGLPGLVRAGFGFGAAIALAWTVLAIHTLRQGRFNIRFQGNAMAGLAWVTVIVVFTVFSMLAPKAAHPEAALLGMVTTVGFLIVGLAFLLGNAISQSTLQVREEMLKLELQIARLTERLNDASPKKDETKGPS